MKKITVVRQNLTNLDESLEQAVKFWFGVETAGNEVDVESLGRELWFVSDHNKLELVDRNISSKFGSLLQQIEELNLEEGWENRFMSSKTNLLGSILVLDQFSRHIYRSPANNLQIEKNTRNAAKLSRNIVDLNLSFLFSPAELSFALMPLRHLQNYQVKQMEAANDFNLFDSSELDEVLKEVESCERRFENELKVLSRFKRATLQRKQTAIDLAAGIREKSSFGQNLFCGYEANELLDRKCFNFNLDWKTSDAVNENNVFVGLHNTILDFILKRSPGLVSVRENPPKDEKDKVKMSCNFFVSLSGGVDSMVILHILSRIKRNQSLLLLNPNAPSANGGKKSEKRLEKKRMKRLMKIAEKEGKSVDEYISHQNRFAKKTQEQYLESRKAAYNLVDLEVNVVAVHIDYGNRKESRAEAEFLRQYCESLDVAFELQEVSESLRRGVGDRDEYERETRNIRFAKYRSSFEKYSNESSNSEIFQNGVFVGHHKGDLEENALCNVMKGAGIDNISGMSEESWLDEVAVLRPLLTHYKKDIFDYAEMYKVPYFRDTTPHWATRYKIRFGLLNEISDCFGEGFGQNLLTLAKESDEISEILQRKIFKPYMNSVDFGRLGVKLPILANDDQAIEEINSFFFWKLVLRNVFHSIGSKSVHDRAINVLLSIIKELKSKENVTWVELKNDNRCFIYNFNQLIVLHNSFCSDNRTFPSFEAIPFEVSSKTSFNPNNYWNINITPLENNEAPAFDEATDLLDFIKTGTISYHLKGAFKQQFKIDPSTSLDIPRLRRIPRKMFKCMPLVVAIVDGAVDEEVTYRIELQFSQTCGSK